MVLDTEDQAFQDTLCFKECTDLRKPPGAPACECAPLTAWIGLQAPWPTPGTGLRQLILLNPDPTSRAQERGFRVVNHTEEAPLLCRHGGPIYAQLTSLHLSFQPLGA